MRFKRKDGFFIGHRTKIGASILATAGLLATVIIEGNLADRSRSIAERLASYYVGSNPHDIAVDIAARAGVFDPDRDNRIPGMGSRHYMEAIDSYLQAGFNPRNQGRQERKN